MLYYKNFLRIIFCVASFISIKTNAQINADFSGSPLAGCAPLTVQFSDLSSGNPTTWSWNFGNGNTSTTKNPAAIYPNPGTYTVVLTASNGGSSSTKTKTAYVVVYTKPTAKFTINSDTVCVGDLVTFSDASTVSPGGAIIKQWGWDYGDGSVQATTIPSSTHTYTNAGTFPISLIITDANGCTNSVIKNIVVIPKPTITFTATPTSSCTAPLVVTFTNTSSTTNSTTFLWQFGDGGTSTLKNPTHTYTALGLYTVTLQVNQNGCISSLVKTSYIKIQAINANFVASPTTACTGKNIAFTNTSSPTPASVLWNFGDGGTSVAPSTNHVYNAAGTYTVTLIVTDASGCKDTLVKTNYITINQTPLASFTPNNVIACELPFTVNFTDGSTGAGSWNWNFGDGGTSTSQNPSHTYNNIGSNTVTLTVANANNTCFSTVVKTNYITYAPPIANYISVPDSGCAPLTVNFTDASISTASAIVNHTWIFGDGNQTSSATTTTSHVYVATGIYTVTHIIQTASGCTDTIICTNCIKVGIKPTAKFGIVDDTVCYGQNVFFVDSSTNATGWKWLFGDGGTSNLKNPSHNYGLPGIYFVKVIAYNNGCPDTSDIKQVVILPPKAQFTASLNCINYYTVAFNSTSIGADSLFWDFGDGTTNSSNIKTPSHTYAARGSYTVSLTAFNYASGCSHTTSVSFTIAEPIANFTQSALKGCYPFSTNFTSTSQDALSLFWTFGNGKDSTGITTAASYPALGTYPVNLIITDVNGCKDTLTKTITSYGPVPYFYANALKGCTPLPITFVDTTHSDSTLVQWTWNFGDGVIITTTNDSIVHTYATPGVYTVTMTVQDINGCSKTLTIPNYIKPTFPFPSFTVNSFACIGDVITFNASATSVSTGATYSWNFGDGITNSTTNPITTHTYNANNIYTISLKVIDANGCDSTITKTITIEKPVANFGWAIQNAGCGTLQVAFSDSSHQNIAAWKWDFGNGASSTLKNPVYTYTSPGVYSVTLVVTNSGGCKDTLTLDSIIVVSGPIGSFTFTPSTGCIPLTVTFSGTSPNSQNFVWDFGDGTVVSGNDTVVHTYKYVGVFNPILVLNTVLTNGNPCSLPATNLTGNVTTVNGFTVVINPSTISVPEDSVYNNVLPLVSGATSPIFNWSPSTGINCATCQNINVTGTGDTILYYFTVVDNSTGCIQQDSLLVLSRGCLAEKLIPNVFSPNGDGKNDVFYVPTICYSEDFSLEIYDRWGILMFTSKHKDERWDGKNKSGGKAPDGVYYYIVKVLDRTYTGFVQLIR